MMPQMRALRAAFSGAPAVTMDAMQGDARDGDVGVNDPSVRPFLAKS
jgi:hypothetical protein